MTADHHRAPVLEALVGYHRQGQLAFSPPGHNQARGADPSVREVLGDAVFVGDMLASGGLDDRLRELAAEVRAAVEEIDGMHVDDRDDLCGQGLADDFDPLPCVIDLTGLGISGFQAADWLREHRQVDMHLNDHRRIGGRITHADDRDTTAQLLAALKDLPQAAPDLPRAPRVEVLEPAELRPAQAVPPRDAFFGPTEDVPVSAAAGRVTAEMITPYPPGVPAILPGERLTEPVVRHLTTGLKAGMNLPDASDPELKTIRVVAADADPGE
ncbi:hypothetical protein ACIRJO_16070 [Streptomyces sp. NPDC102394]|uniref:Orn/Lys/Arg family decarboxylase n=1 Tax=Streptomyces sp. NPDC102394 TaxID=3366167 RepID=UPI0038206ECF